MSDCFDHEGDAWEQVFNGYGDEPRHNWQPGHDVTCKLCGERGLKWRETVDGWRLFSKERGAHNEKLQHFCSKPAGADEFEDCDQG